MFFFSCSVWLTAVTSRQELFVTNWEAYKALRDIKTKKAAGPDGIPSVVLKLFAFELAPVVTDLYNPMLREGFIPPLLKSAIVHPLPKLTPPKCIEDDVRSISLTCQLAKVLEGFTLARVYPSIVGNLNRNQFAVAGIDRAGPCLSFTPSFTSPVQGWLLSKVIFGDFKKRFWPYWSRYINGEDFYTVNLHWSLLMCLMWVASLLQGRAQVTRVGASVSASSYIGMKISPVSV